MYNEQIEVLISAALADGVLTEKEKQILFKKAESMGIALDEFETGRCFQLGCTDDAHRHIVKAHVTLRIVNIHNNCPQNDRQRQR